MKIENIRLKKAQPVIPFYLHVCRLRDIHGAVIDILGILNCPRRDEAIVRKAGISLDWALFPPLVGIERFGSIGVVEMANRVGRDHTTVSRQMTKLENLGPVDRQVESKVCRRSLLLKAGSGIAQDLRIDDPDRIAA